MAWAFNAGWCLCKLLFVSINCFYFFLIPISVALAFICGTQAVLESTGSSDQADDWEYTGGE